MWGASARQAINKITNMQPVTKAQFEQIKAKFKALKSELNTEKLAEFAENVDFFKQYAPWVPTGDVVMRQEWNELADDVKRAHRASLISNSETQNYRRFKTNCEDGIKAHPDAATNNQKHADLMQFARENPAKFRELANSLGGLTSEQKRQELPHE